MKFTADYLFVKSVVTVDDNAVDSCLWTFHDTHFQGNGVAFDFRFDGHKLEEEVAVVHVEVGYGVFVFCRTLVEQCLVVDVTRLDAENVVECRRRIDCVACPRDVGNEVLFAFFHINVDIYGLFVVLSYAVAYDASIAVAQFVIFLDDEVQVVFVVRFHEFFLAEKVEQLSFFVGFLHYSLNLVVAQHLVAGNIDFMNLYLFVLVDVDVDNHFVFLADVRSQSDVDCYVAEALLLEKCSDDIFCSVDDVLGNLVARHQAEALFQFLFFTLFATSVVDFRDTRLLAQVEHEPRFVAVDFFNANLNFREQSLAPEAFGRIGDVIARNFHHVTDRQA